MAIEHLTPEVIEPERGDWTTAADISRLINLHREVMVERSSEDVEGWFGGRSIVVRAINPSTGLKENAAFVAFTHEYEDEGVRRVELGAVVTNPVFNGFRRELAALAILRILDLDIAGKYDQVFALVAAANNKSIPFFEGLPEDVAESLDPHTLPDSIFRESINGVVDGPDKYKGFLFRRSKRQEVLHDLTG